MTLYTEVIYTEFLIENNCNLTLCYSRQRNYYAPNFAKLVD